MNPSELIELFPTPFLRVPALLPPALVAKLLQELGEAELQPNSKCAALAHTPVVQPASSPLYTEVAAAVGPYLAEFGELLFGEPLPWRIKEMWMNRLEPGGYQALHSHANSFASGVLYLTESHPSSRTVLYRDLGGRDFTFSNDHPGSRPGPFNSAKWAVPLAAPGDLILFPSYLLHEVPANRGPQRATLAFNAVPGRLRSWGYGLEMSPLSEK